MYTLIFEIENIFGKNFRFLEISLESTSVKDDKFENNYTQPNKPIFRLGGNSVKNKMFEKRD